MKKRSIFSSIIALVIILSNIPPTSYMFDYALDEKHYRYKNNSGLFDVTDRSENNMEGVKNSFQEFIKTNKVQSEDTILYRTFWKNPLAFWRWNSYINSEDKRYKLPYKQ